MPGTLFVVATPIGNLEDITLRALRVLRVADLIAAEDTRRTARLLAAHGIATPTMSFYEHNTRTRIPQLISRLLAGDSVALVTDAGTPGVSDPGVELVRACVEAGVDVDPVPGVTAPMAAAVASGFPLTPMTIWGFAPSRSKDRNSWLQAISLIPHTLTFFEAPHRIVGTLRAASPILVERPISVARELTKIHQEVLRGTASELADRLEGSQRGEFTVVIGPLPKLAADALPDDRRIVEMFGQLANDGSTSRRAAVSQTARRLGVSSKTVYAAVERSKNR